MAQRQLLGSSRPAHRTQFVTDLPYPRGGLRSLSLIRLAKEGLLGVVTQIKRPSPESAGIADPSISRLLVESASVGHRLCLSTPPAEIHMSNAQQKGVPLRVVADRLGYASAAFTLSTYSHTLPGQDEAAAATFDGMMRRAMGSLADR